MIIAFPGLVTGSLTKGPTVDVDKAFQQMQMAPKESSPGAPNPAASDVAPASEAASAALPTPPSGDQSKSSDDDAMQRLIESMQKDAPKKP
jgi:hypothetical protein